MSIVVGVIMADRRTKEMAGVDRPFNPLCQAQAVNLSLTTA